MTKFELNDNLRANINIFFLKKKKSGKFSTVFRL
jgi:hypothetical protein